MNDSTPESDSTKLDMNGVWAAFEAAWYEEPPRRLTPDDLCRMFPEHSCDQIHANYETHCALLRWSDLRVELENLARDGRPPNWEALVGDAPDWLERAKAHFAKCGGREAGDYLAEAAASLNLRDYPGPRSTYETERLHRERERARPEERLKQIERDIELTGVAGSGGFGIVFEAYDAVLDRRVAVKKVLPCLKDRPGAKERLEREAMILAKLEHPNILPMYNILKPHPQAGREAEPAFVMRLLPETLVRGNVAPGANGDPPKVVVRRLKDAIEEFYSDDLPWDATTRRRNRFRQLLQQFVDVCHGIAYAHQRKVIHRDIKPGNIVIGPHGETVVIDWGIALVLVADERRAGDLSRPATLVEDMGFQFSLDGSGTGPYASPEQWPRQLGGPGLVDRASQGSPAMEARPVHPMLTFEAVRQPTDVYALGATLWEILNGRTPPDGIAHEHRFDYFPEGTPYTLQHIVRKATAFDPWDRYIGQRELEWFQRQIPTLKDRSAPGADGKSRSEDTRLGGVEQLRNAVQNWLDEEAAEQIAGPLRQEVAEVVAELKRSREESQREIATLRDETDVAVSEKQRTEAELTQTASDLDSVRQQVTQQKRSAGRLKRITSTLAAATFVIGLLAVWGIYQNRHQQSVNQGLKTENQHLQSATDELQTKNEELGGENEQLHSMQKQLQSELARTERERERSAATMAKFVADIDSASSLAKLGALERVLQGLPPKEHRSASEGQLALAAQVGRCKLLHHLDHLRESEEAGVAALEMIAELPGAELSHEARAMRIGLLHELVDVRADRGDVRAMKTAVDQALHEVGEIAKPMKDQSSGLMLQSLTYQKVGYYYEVIGNPWKRLRAHESALAYARQANSMDDSPETRIHLTRSERLVAAGIEAVRGEMQELRGENDRRRRSLVDSAMQRVKDTSNGSMSALENESWLLEQQAAVASDAGHLDEMQRIKQLRDVVLAVLTQSDPYRPRLRLQRIHNDLLTMMQMSMKTADPSKWETRIAAYQPELDRLAKECPENLDLQTQPLEFLRGLALFTYAEGLKGEEQAETLRRSNEAFARYFDAVSQVVEKAPLVRRFGMLQSTTRQYRGAIAELQGAQQLSPQLRLESLRADREYYEARFADAPDEPEWMWMAADEAFTEASIYAQAGRFSEALERMRHSRSLLERVQAADSIEPYVVSLYARSLSVESGTEWQIGAQARSPGLLAGEEWARKFAAESKVLQLRHRILTMVAEPDRLEARQMLDDAYSLAAPSVRLESIYGLLQAKRGPFLARFGSYDGFRREWLQARSEGLSGEELAGSPFTPSKPDDNSIRSSVPEGLENVLRAKLKQVELIGANLFISPFVMDENLISAAADRIRSLREPDASTSEEERERNQLEVQWMLRTIRSCLSRIERRGERGKWLTWMQQAADAEIARLEPPKGFLWQDNVKRANEWRAMNYAALGQAALEENRLADWFAFTNGEFSAASQLLHAPSEDPQAASAAAATWGEMVIARQLTDDLFLNEQLRNAVVEHVRSNEDEWINWTPVFRGTLASLVWLTGDTELAVKLQPGINAYGFPNFAARIANFAVATRQFDAIRPSAARWAQQLEAKEYRNSVTFAAVHSALELGDAADAEKLLDTLSGSAPGLTGWRWRARLVKNRDLTVSELLEQLGDVREVDPEQDFQAAAIAAYCQTLRSKSADDVQRLAALAKLPHCDDQPWLLELVGDAWSHAGSAENARASYQACLSAFPPATSATDVSVLRVNRKLRGLTE